MRRRLLEDVEAGLVDDWAGYVAEAMLGVLDDAVASGMNYISVPKDALVPARYEDVDAMADDIADRAHYAIEHEVKDVLRRLTLVALKKQMKRRK